MYKASLVGADPWWFATDGEGPFDLSNGLGTCYVSLDLDQTIGEVVGPASGRFRAVNEAQARRLRVVPLRVRRPFRLASVDHAKARPFGLGGGTYADEGSFDETKEWAAALQAAGFDGVLFSPRFIDTAKVSMAALFGAAGTPSPGPLEVAGAEIDGITASLAAGFEVVPEQLRTHYDLI